jgi:hypothetical protein
MSTRTATLLQHNCTLPATEHEFRIEIVYETPAAGAPALGVCERLIEQFSGTFPLRVATHSFKALEAELRACSTPRDHADMIFVASAGALPDALVEWLDRQDHRSADAPVALVDMTVERTPNAGRIREFLKRAAEQHHLELFSQEHFERDTTSTSSSPRSVPCHTVRHWGINE